MDDQHENLILQQAAQTYKMMRIMQYAGPAIVLVVGFYIAQFIFDWGIGGCLSFGFFILFALADFMITRLIILPRAARKRDEIRSAPASFLPSSQQSGSAFN